MKNKNVNKKKMHSIVKWMSLISFLLLSSPAISQSVTVSNEGDTLVCFPDEMVRQIIKDLEKGDLCETTAQSYLIDIQNLKTAIEAKDSEIGILDDKIDNYVEIGKEKDKQIEAKEKIILANKVVLRGRMFQSFIGGSLAGIVIGVVIML